LFFHVTESPFGIVTTAGTKPALVIDTVWLEAAVAGEAAASAKTSSGNKRSLRMLRIPPSCS
jgi:hypothetical protein